MSFVIGTKAEEEPSSGVRSFKKRSFHLAERELFGLGAPKTLQISILVKRIYLSSWRVREKNPYIRRLASEFPASTD